MLCVPSLYSALLAEVERRPGWSPSAAIVAGEECPRDLVERHRRLLPGTALYNEYGPTEGTVWCTVHACREGDVARRVPVGRPVRGARVYVLGRAGEPVPPGVPGELYVGGAGVARGYLGLAGPTAEKFVPDPFSPEPGARLYRTGDRARWRADGEMEFLGRLDEQVKIRGFRIEPGEIEAALLCHADVREAVVAVREDGPDDKRLVAYVAGGAEAEALRSHLRRSLPEHMVPAAFVGVERLPRTPNGKVDRRALPSPERDGSEGKAGYVAPRTPLEDILCGTWAEVLRRERVGIHDDFFEMGGHSLLATRLASRLREAFQVEVPVRTFFEAPTVARLSRHVAALIEDGSYALAPPIVPVPRDGSPLPLSFAQQRLWFIDRLDPGGSAYNIPLALRLRGPLDAAVLGRTIAEVVRRHEALRTVFGEVDGEPVQVVHPAGPSRLGLTDLSHLPPGAREPAALRLFQEDARRSFDLCRGPLLRTNLLRLSTWRERPQCWRSPPTACGGRRRGSAPRAFPAPCRRKWRSGCGGLPARREPRSTWCSSPSWTSCSPGGRGRRTSWWERPSRGVRAGRRRD